MEKTITWLHISDLHARSKGAWDLRNVTKKLVDDLKKMQSEKNIRPDFIFFTGDAAFGSVPGDSMPDQYVIVRTFFDAVRNAFEPPVSKRNIYIVPGNHDVDRTEISRGELEWLRDSRRTLAEITAATEAVSKEWRLWMQRFEHYRNFLRSYGLTHLNPDDPHLIWKDVQEIRGVRVGIAGFNSAWSCSDDSDKGKLWASLDFQVQKNIDALSDTQLCIALLHHPGNWLTPAEDPSAMRRLRNKFPIVLHGHEHQEWVDTSQNGHIIVSSGACYESSWMSNGYNFGYINLNSHSGGIWLREWDNTGEGWVPRNIAHQTNDGMWPLNGLEWISEEENSINKKHTPIKSSGEYQTKEFNNYTKLFCENIIKQFDYLELFGCDIPKYLQRHQLSVAYVSLNISHIGTDGISDTGPITDLPEEIESAASELDFHPRISELEGSFSLDILINNISNTGNRLTIFGPAGAGKSTLMRWCAIQAANSFIDQNISSNINGKIGITAGEHNESSDAGEGWKKVPFLVKLRDCKNGKLPAANDLPAFIAKHLQSAPSGWITSLLASGEAFILLDGVDEVHKDLRPQMALEIEELVKTYPNCSYLVTSRQGAVPQGWLQRLGFSEASVEPMSKDDREEFIDKWYKSARLETRTLAVGENLEKTALGLKQELNDQPELGLLATNPLVCAMICALYKERQEKLPETPSELCEALVQMLLHRRERETPGMNDQHFAKEWRSLQYAQKKGLIADLAWLMVEQGSSQISKQEAMPIVTKAMASTPGKSGFDSAEVLDAAIERSGLLRPSGDDHISFIHNTLKEYLAAGRAVDHDDWQILAENADDPAWQPVVLFSLALAPEPFNNKIISTLLKNSPNDISNGKRSKPLTKANQALLAQSNARAFFLVRGKKSAKRLSAEYSQKIEALTGQLLPPLYMQDVEVLAQLGHRLLAQSGDIFKSPRWWSSQDARMATRCLRLLRLIGGSRSKLYLNSIQQLPSGSSLLTGEWILACCELENTDSPWPFKDKNTVQIENTHVASLVPLAKLTSLRYLDATNTNISDIEVLGTLKSLLQLDISFTNVKSLTPITLHKNINFLNISGTEISDLSPILGCTSSLRILRARNTKISDISPLHGMGELKTLILDRCPISDISPLAECKSIEVLSLKGTPVQDISPLQRLANLQNIDLDDTKITTIESLENLSTIRNLSVRGTGIISIGNIGNLPKLRKLILSGSKLESLGHWSEDSEISTLQIHKTSISDINPIRSCKNLRSLNLSHSPIHDISALIDLPHISSLNISFTLVSDYGPLRFLKNLKSVHIQGSSNMDLSYLIPLEYLSWLQVYGAQIDKAELKKFAAARPDVTVVALNFINSPALIKDIQ